MAEHIRYFLATTILLTLSVAATLSMADPTQGDCSNGQGTYALANGDKYVGEWKYGERNGQGTLTFADGSVESGLWEYGH